MPAGKLETFIKLEAENGVLRMILPEISIIVNVLFGYKSPFSIFRYPSLTEFG
jgi:hypothetical protein